MWHDQRLPKGGMYGNMTSNILRNWGDTPNARSTDESIAPKFQRMLVNIFPYLPKTRRRRIEPALHPKFKVIYNKQTKKTFVYLILLSLLYYMWENISTYCMLLERGKKEILYLLPFGRLWNIRMIILSMGRVLSIAI